MNDKVTNVVFAGLGGQGVIKASDIFADVVFRTGADVKKAEIHGMSQRGGSVQSEVRFGPQVMSPMVPAGEADFLVVLAPDQVDNNLHCLRPGGVMITPDLVPLDSLQNRKSLNIALLGALSHYLDIDQELWQAAIRAALPERLLEPNLQAFAAGRSLAGKCSPPRPTGKGGNDV